MIDITLLQNDQLKKILLSWEEVDADLCRKKKWNIVMFFPSFTQGDGLIIKKVIDDLKMKELIEFDSRHVDGEVDFAPACLAPTIENIMGNDGRYMFAVPRVLTTRNLDFVVLMTSEYWCLYAEKTVLESAVGMSLENYHQQTTRLLTDSYTEDDLIVYQNKLSELSETTG